MKICSMEFTANWSWGLIFREIKNMSGNEIQRVFVDDGGEPEPDTDITLVQNVSLLSRVKSKISAICRMGGNRSFDEHKPGLDDVLCGMSECFAMIATNKFLYEIGKSVNPRTYMIPNGLNLDEWKPRNFRVGFCANVTTARYREYKGYDLVADACSYMGFEMVQALYRSKQIPHEKMMTDFYWNIDCLVHPTSGEGSSNAIMEALACGVPCITTREAGYHGEFLEDGINVLFCERTTESIIECLRALACNPELRQTLSTGGRKFAERHHDIRTIAKEYERIFEECYEYNHELKARQEREARETTVLVKALKSFKYRDVRRVYPNTFMMLKLDTDEYRAKGCIE